MKRTFSVLLTFCGRQLAGVMSAVGFLSMMVAFVLSTTGSASPLTTSPSADDEPALVYVPGTSGGITEINSASDVVFGTAPWAHGSNGGIAVTRDGSRLYVSNHEISSVSVFDTTTNVPISEIGVGLNPIGLALTPDGTRVYVANQTSNNVSVIATATNTVVDTIAVGLNPIWVTISHDGSRAYVSNQNDSTLSVIATASNSVIASIPVGTFPFHSLFTSGGRFLWVSAQGDNVVDVVDTNTNTVVSTIPAGTNPRGIGFSSDGGHAYVADFGSNTVAVIDVASETLTGFITVGAAPWGLAITPRDLVYVANFGSNTVSVIDSSTNQVIDTVNARTGPADVTVTTRAHPLVLGYRFTPIAPVAALYSLARGLNDHGDAVGDYLDSSFGYHGFLRTHDGILSTIDPPGATATSAFSINNSGVIVGAYIDSLHVLHGFRRSSTGSYVTIDFPGAPDSQLTGINNAGETAGVYDLGNLASTNCPGPNCGAVSFFRKNGQFTSFQDPSAAPGVTFAQSVNDRGQIAGFYQDIGGGVFGFLRRPSDGSFKTIQFPVPGNFSTAGQVNNFGVVAGEYQITFLQGYLAFCSHFLSIDYPNSAISGLRAVNNRGEVAGYFAFPGGPVEAYIAIPQEPPSD
jgi:YVTN family beta-propeller protein